MQRNENAVTQEHATTVLFEPKKRLLCSARLFVFWIVLVGFLCSAQTIYTTAGCGLRRGCDIGGYFILFFLKRKKGQQLNWRVAGCKTATKANDELAVVVECFCPCFFGGWPFSFTVLPGFSFSFCWARCASCVQIATAKAVWGLGIILAVIELFRYSCSGWKLCAGVGYKYSKRVERGAKFRI